MKANIRSTVEIDLMMYRLRSKKQLTKSVSYIWNEYISSESVSHQQLNPTKLIEPRFRFYDDKNETTEKLCPQDASNLGQPTIAASEIKMALEDWLINLTELAPHLQNEIQQKRTKINMSLIRNQSHPSRPDVIRTCKNALIHTAVNQKNTFRFSTKLIPRDVITRKWIGEEDYTQHFTLICILDISGSINDQQRQIALLFIYWLSRLYQRITPHLQLLHIHHHQKATIVSADHFYKLTSRGGTLCSSALICVNKWMKVHATKLNTQSLVDLVHLSDGHNLRADNQIYTQWIKQLTPHCRRIAYVELSNPQRKSHLMLELDQITSPKFHKDHLAHQKDILNLMQKISDRWR